MKAFHTIAIPHDDILTGRLTMNAFAADLWEVFKGRGPDEYRDAQLFFQKTYPTEGLKSLLDVVRQRLEGRGGDPVIQLQTPFGGGKTHALIAMYHRAAEWGVRRAVIVGTPLAANETLWGLLAEQLAGSRDGFGGMAAPGREALRNLLARHQPAVILMDELLEYVTKAAGVSVGESNLAAQTLAFVQELTEVAGTLERVILMVTLPSSLLEHYDEKAERLYQQLQRIAGRVEKIYTPVQENEITKVIRRRLFAHLDEKGMREAVDGFCEYARQESLLPAGVEVSEYRERFCDSYPFLPEVVDVLYHRWGSFPTFQRTRGVLRLLALVVHRLKGEPIPYISLADVDLASQEIRRELLKHIGSEYDSVIAADITGPEAAARKVSAGLGKAYQGLKLGERVATSVFLYSFSGGVERGGTLAEIKRSATTLDNPASAVSEAVDQLKERSFYLQQQGGRYFFTNQPNLNRILLTRMENIADEELREMEHNLLRERVGSGRFPTFIWPKSSDDIPDTAELKLVVLRERDEALMRSILEQKGNMPRVNRNAMFLLVGLQRERSAFEELLRKHLAYRGLRDDRSLKLTEEQQKEVKDGVDRTQGDLREGVCRVYRELFLPAREGWRELDLGMPTYGERRRLDEIVYDRLRSEGEILERIAPLVIKERYLRERDWVRTEQLAQSSRRTPGESRVMRDQAWEVGIAEGVRQGLFGLGELEEGDRPVCRFFREEPSVMLAGNEIIIRAEICQQQREAPPPLPVYPPEEEKPVETKVVEGVGGIAMQPTLPGFTLEFALPRGKVSDLGKVMNFLQQRFAQMHITLRVQGGALTEQEYEDKVKEAFRQMGVEITKEDQS